jgi:hypothetical protein
LVLAPQEYPKLPPTCDPQTTVKIKPKQLTKSVSTHATMPFGTFAFACPSAP